jgi:hypothetical protein
MKMLETRVLLLTPIIVCVLGVVIEVWALCIAYQSSWGAVLLTLVLPGLSQLYWIWAQWSATGILFSWFAILTFGWMVAFLLLLRFARIAGNGRAERSSARPVDRARWQTEPQP